MSETYLSVINFWFEELQPSQWFIKDEMLDQNITKRFGHLLQEAERCELSGWRSTAEGRLAEIILLDQFSRNIYRGTPKAFANDPVALVLAQEMISGNHHMKLESVKRRFVYMPFMHSESAKIHEETLPLFQAFGDPELLDYELQHKEIIDRFGRYPHRNKILSRHSTPEEIIFMKDHPGF